MPNDTSFAVLYKKLIDRNFEPDPQRLAEIRASLLSQLTARDPPMQADRLWTQKRKYDTMNPDEKKEKKGNEEGI